MLSIEEVKNLNASVSEVITSQRLLETKTHIALDDLHEELARWRVRLEAGQDSAFTEQPVPDEQYQSLMGKVNRALGLVQMEWQRRITQEPDEEEIRAIELWDGQTVAPGRAGVGGFNWQRNLADIRWLGELRLAVADAQVEDYLTSLEADMTLGSQPSKGERIYLRRWYKAHHALDAIKTEAFMRTQRLSNIDCKEFNRVRDLHIREADTTPSGEKINELPTAWSTGDRPGGLGKV